MIYEELIEEVDDDWEKKHKKEYPLWIPGASIPRDPKTGKTWKVQKPKPCEEVQRIEEDIVRSAEKTRK